MKKKTNRNKAKICAVDNKVEYEKQKQKKKGKIKKVEENEGNAILNVLVQKKKHNNSNIYIEFILLSSVPDNSDFSMGELEQALNDAVSFYFSLFVFCFCSLFDFRYHILFFTHLVRNLN